MLKEFDYINELIPFYQELLTEKQQEILNLYYYEDLSLSEIAENLNISRNAVYDSLKKSVKIIQNYENILHLLNNYEQRIKLYNELEKINNDKVINIVNKLKKLEDR